MTSYLKAYDIIVVGGGHAGCEAALAAARMGCSVLLMAIDLDKIAAMPCSPSIGGMAKGQLVREVDALGGEMARITDQTAIQYKMLNTKKGPAVQSSRTQNDKQRYHMAMKAVIERQPGLDLKQALVENLVVENGPRGGTGRQHRLWLPIQSGDTGHRHISQRFGAHRFQVHSGRPGRGVCRLRTGRQPPWPRIRTGAHENGNSTPTGA
jgi:hypothetical protein